MPRVRRMPKTAVMLAIEEPAFLFARTQGTEGTRELGLLTDITGGRGGKLQGEELFLDKS
jgi:hypothetical protein